LISTNACQQLLMVRCVIVHLLIIKSKQCSVPHSVLAPSNPLAPIPLATQISSNLAPGTMTRRKSKTINELSRVGTTPMQASVNAGVLPATSPPATAPPAGAPVPPPPIQCELTSRMEQSVLDVREKFRPDQTADVYDNKTQEFLQFASHVYPQDPYKNSLNAEKVYRFMFYETFRGQKKRGGK
jgi:hypothetical protein